MRFIIKTLFEIRLLFNYHVEVKCDIKIVLIFNHEYVSSPINVIGIKMIDTYR